MKKTICITPADKTMEGWVRAVKLNNDFRVLGYTKREAFVDVVRNTLDAYQSDYKKIQQLQNFWAMRDRDGKLMEDLQTVLDTLNNK